MKNLRTGPGFRGVLWSISLAAALFHLACASTSSDLLRIATEGNPERLQSLLSDGVDVNESDKRGNTALMVAAANGHLAAVRLLLANGALVDATAENLSTALMRAAVGGHADVARALLAAGADERAESQAGWTALRWADAAGHENIVRLLQEGASNMPPEAERSFASARRISDEMVPPQLQRQVRPIYTQDALQQKVEGIVLLEVVIQTNGIIGPVRVLRALDIGLDLQAIRCVREWRFIPGKVNGVSADVLGEIEVEFSIL